MNGIVKPIAFAMVCYAQFAPAATLSFTGNLRTDATVLGCGPGCTLGPGDTDEDFAQYAAVVRTFTVSVPSVVGARTFGYGGGVNGAGATVLEGGFAPYLSLFDSGGNFLASTFFGTTCPPGAQTNTGSGQCYDVALADGVLAPGDYQLGISAYLNLSLAENAGSGSLTDGYTGLGNLAAGGDLHYAFDVVLSNATEVPEPGTWGMLAVAVSLSIHLRRKIRDEK
ncbi:MAG: DVUA0089 family protein [Acidobacteria bacterium]|nr:DVUA0089 family protein [Acidobacteriota bacterium]